MNEVYAFVINILSTFASLNGELLMAVPDSIFGFSKSRTDHYRHLKIRLMFPLMKMSD